MSEESTVVHPEYYAFEIGTMSLVGEITDRGDGRCAIRGIFRDSATGAADQFRFLSVTRESFADLARSFADNIAPARESSYGFWCESHYAELEGKPQFVHDENTRTWDLDLSDMECPHSEDLLDCRPTWRMGNVALEGHQR